MSQIAVRIGEIVEKTRGMLDMTAGRGIDSRTSPTGAKTSAIDGRTSGIVVPAPAFVRVGPGMTPQDVPSRHKPSNYAN